MSLLPTSSSSLLASIPSVVDSNDQLVLRGRVKNPAEVRADYQSLFSDDWAASRDRALMQAAIDGSPPYSDAKDRMLGMFGRTNVNWGLSTQAQLEAEQPFNDILDSLDHFGIIPIKPGIVSDQEAGTFEQIIAEELHSTITGWDDFYFSWWLNAHFFTMWGVSFTFRDDNIDWRWKVQSLQGLKIPRGSRATVNGVDRICCKVDMLPSELWAKIKDDEVLAEKAGWNKQAIINACKNAQPKAIPSDNPEELQAMWKDNSINSGNTNLVVEVIHEWVEEVDGTVSHYMAPWRADDSGAAEKFIYNRVGEYKCMADLVNPYFYGVGTNGDIHSIRGNAYALFAAAQAINKLMCKFIDKAVDESNTYITAENEDAVQDLAVFPRGPYVQITNGMSFVERKAVDVAQNLMPAIQSMREVFQARSSGMAPRAASVADRGQKTKYELQRRDEMDGKLSSAVMNLFFRGWANDYRITSERLLNPDIQEKHPGGKEAVALRERCLRRGVPQKALDNLDFGRIQTNMGIGKGSGSERRSVLEVLNTTVLPRLDQAGQRILTRDTVSAYTNAAYARRLVPDEEGLRPPIDQQIADMENTMMSLGGSAEVVVNQDHVTHAGTHITLLIGLNDQLEQAQVELQQVIPQMQQVSEHTGKHMELIDPENENFKSFKEVLQQMNEVIANGAKHIEAESRRAQKAQAEGKEPPPTEGTPAGVYGQSVDAKARAEVALGNNKLVYQKKEADQKLAINDLLAAQKMRHAAAMQQVKSAQQSKTRQTRKA